MKRRTWIWKEARLPQDTAKKLHASFELGLYEAFLQVEPENIEALAALGDLYTKAGQLEKGLEVDKRLVAMSPEEPLYHYNLACSHSLLGHIDPAFQALTQALQLGYNKLNHLIDDPDLANLKKDNRYEAILKQLENHGGKKLSG